MVKSGEEIPVRLVVVTDAHMQAGPIGPKLRFWPTQRTDGELLIK